MRASEATRDFLDHKSQSPRAGMFCKSIETPCLSLATSF